MTRHPEAEGAARDTAARKGDHLRLSLGADVGSTITTGLERYRLRATALPERALDDVDLGCTVLGHRLRAPLLVSCMTGGVSEAGPVNRALAAAAQEHGVAFGLGSGRALLADGGRDAMAGGFAVRDVAPDVLLLANLGAVQVVQLGVPACRRLVDICEADALVVHLNPIQEAVQPGGDTDFSGVIAAIAAACDGLGCPVLVKEVGFGLAPADVRRLVEVGVAGIDVAGAGGTNWAIVEGLRSERAGRVAAAFTDWGVPTADAVVGARAVLDDLGSPAVLAASGGLAHGVDALKALCLGADLAGVARGLLAAGAAGQAAAVDAVGVLVEQLRMGLWAVGAGTLGELGPHLLTEA